jgi:signal transduction histidine kinase
MAQKIIKGHRGIIEVESTLGVGSTFRIVVPIME